MSRRRVFHAEKTASAKVLRWKHVTGTEGMRRAVNEVMEVVGATACSDAEFPAVRRTTDIRHMEQSSDMTNVFITSLWLLGREYLLLEVGSGDGDKGKSRSREISQKAITWMQLGGDGFPPLDQSSNHVNGTVWSDSKYILKISKIGWGQQIGPFP